MTSNSPIDFVSIMKTVSQQSLDDLLQSEDFSEWMTDYLSNHTVVVEFTKQNGDHRKMRCTRNFNMIPEAQQPKGIKKSSTNSIAAFDLDKNEWRSFIPNSVTRIEWGTTYDNLHRLKGNIL